MGGGSFLHSKKQIRKISFVPGTGDSQILRPAALQSGRRISHTLCDRYILDGTTKPDVYTYIKCMYAIHVAFVLLSVISNRHTYTIFIRIPIYTPIRIPYTSRCIHIVGVLSDPSRPGGKNRIIIKTTWQYLHTHTHTYAVSHYLSRLVARPPMPPSVLNRAVSAMVVGPRCNPRVRI